MTILRVLLGVVILTIIVIIHELGHFLVAKRNGVDVEEFGVGFPPAVWGKKLGRGIMECYYTVNLLPLGGFVKLKGENSADNSPGSFGAASLWVKSKITYAGVAMNLLTAFVLLSVVAAIRMPVVIDGQFRVDSDSQILVDEMRVATVLADLPAAEAGLEPGEVVVAIAGQPITDNDSLSRVLSDNAGQPVEIVTRSADDTQLQQRQIKLNSTQQSLQPVLDDKGQVIETGDGDVLRRGYTGASIGKYQEFRASWSAPIVGVVTTLQFTWETLVLLGSMVTNLVAGDFEQAAVGVSGPVGIFYIFSEAASLNMIILLAGVISLSLAVMNFLPIPALDGGRMAVTYGYRLAGRELTAEREDAIHGIGMIVLILLIILITVVDIQRFF